MAEQVGLGYFISEKPPYVVVVFLGQMTKATVDVLEKCSYELAGKPDTAFILNLHDVTSVDHGALAPLTKLQKILRGKGAIRVCSVSPEARKFLIDKGALRENEIDDNLVEALTSLKSQQK